jgi:serine protease Do
MMIRKQLKALIILAAYIINSQATADVCKSGYADLVEPLLPAVVNISTYQSSSLIKNRGKNMPFPEGSPFEEFNQFFEKFGMNPNNMDKNDDEAEDNSSNKKDELEQFSAGSGFIVDGEGFIVTNNHVIMDAEKITITLNNDQKYDAKLIGTDSRTDLALLKIEVKTKLPTIKFGKSEEIRVGDSIVAIGNPFGLGSTVTTGVISAIARDIQIEASSLVDNYIQTDAAINRGNSGGPMFNMAGEVIGINSAIYSPSGGNVGIGFAMPSSIAEPVIQQLKEKGKVQRGWLGVTIQSTKGIAEGLGIKDNKGALVVSIAKGSPAEKSGISVGDIILKFDEKEIISSQKLPRIVSEVQMGKKVKVELLSSGKKKDVYVTLEEFKEPLAKETLAEKSKVKNGTFQGMVLIDLDVETKLKYKIPTEQTGVLVGEVKRKSLASKSGLRIGDIIVYINQKKVNTVNEFKENFEAAKKTGQESVMLWINRAGTNIFMQLPTK